ncbi:MAG: GNAT family N-acetyltransferase [Acidimicrobiales bacterium]
MILRTATIDDLDQITAIYNDAVSSSLVTFDIVPRDRAAQLEWLSSHSGIYPAVVAVDEQSGSGQPALGHTILGFGSLSPYRDRAAYRTTVENSIYVSSRSRRGAVGKTIMETLLDHARAAGFHAVIARMNANNHPSIALHKSLGFKEIGVEREVGRKFGKWLDVLVMEYLL